MLWKYFNLEEFISLIQPPTPTPVTTSQLSRSNVTPQIPRRHLTRRKHAHVCMHWSGEYSKEVPVTAEKADPETSAVTPPSPHRWARWLEEWTPSDWVTICAQKIHYCFLGTGPHRLSVECLGPATFVHSALGSSTLRPVSWQLALWLIFHRCTNGFDLTLGKIRQHLQPGYLSPSKCLDCMKQFPQRYLRAVGVFVCILDRITDWIYEIGKLFRLRKIIWTYCSSQFSRGTTESRPVQDVPLHTAGGPDRPGSPLPGQHCVPPALPSAVVSGSDVRPSTELLGLPAQHLCQEKSLPVSVSWLPA